MIAKTYIEKSLKDLDKLYSDPDSQRKATMYCKMATLELCGWIEDTVDEIVLRHAKRKLKLQSNYRIYQKDFVKKTSGFVYDYHIRGLLMRLIGIIELEEMEKIIEADQAKITVLKAQLNNLVTVRNTAAHTHIKNVTPLYFSPSVCQGYFTVIYDCLKKIDDELRSN